MTLRERIAGITNLLVACEKYPDRVAKPYTEREAVDAILTAIKEVVPGEHVDEGRHTYSAGWNECRGVMLRALNSQEGK